MKRLILFWLLLASSEALSVPLENYQDFVAGGRADAQRVGNQAILLRGSGTRDFYYLEVDPATGAIPVTPVVPADSGEFADSARNAYASTNVTTGAWVQIKASTAAEINNLTLFDSCGQTLELGAGGVGAESRILIIPPGGIDGAVPLHIDAGTRLSLRAISANCTSGEFDLTGIQ